MTKTQKLFNRFSKTHEWDTAKHLIWEKFREFNSQKYDCLGDIKARDELNVRLTQITRELLRFGLRYETLGENSKVIPYTLEMIKDDIILHMITDNNNN